MAVSRRKWLHPDTQEREYIRALTAYHKSYTSETEAQFKKLSMRLDSLSEDIAATIEFILRAAMSAANPLIYSLPDRFMAVSKFNQQQWVLQVKAGTGIDLRAPDMQKMRKTFGMGVNVWQSEPWLIPMRDNWVAANTALIKNMPQQYLTQVDSVVRAGVSQGVGVRGLAKQLEQIQGIDSRRARLIATDQIGKANAALTQQRQADLGIDSYEWSSSNDSRVRPTHAEAEGKIFRWDKPPASTGGHPGYPVRCLPYHSNIEVAHGCHKLWRRSNAAESTHIVTESGKSIEATVNHPVLTNRGWLAIQDIDVGDYVFSTSNKRFHGRESDVQAAPAQIGQIFDTIAGYVGFNTSISSVALEFNGDAIDSEVETIDIDSFLTSEDDAHRLKTLGEFFFAFADSYIDESEFSIDRPLLLSASRLWFSTDSIVRGACKLLSLLNGKASHPQEICLTTVANLCASFDKSRPDGCPSSSVLFGQGEFTSASLIFGNNLLNGVILAVMCGLSTTYRLVSDSAECLNQNIVVASNNISNLSDADFSGTCIENADRVTEKFRSELIRAHVYNLGTANEWYSSDNLIIHNCRCTALPVFPD